MWYKEYKDYPIDQPLIKQQLTPGKGIVGCEMHELNGWGIQHHHPKPKKKGVIASLMKSIFGRNDNTNG